MNWIFTMLKRNKLNQTKSLDFKMWLETETLISSAVENVQRFAGKLVVEARTMRTELDQLKTSLIESYIVTDSWGNKSYLAQPAFTNDEIAKSKRGNLSLKAVIVGFILSEIVLYLMISESLVGPFGTTGAAALSIVFAVFVLLTYSYGLDYSYKIIEARQKHKDNKITDFQLNQAKLELILGLVLIALSTVFLLFAGLGRMYIIEGTNTAFNLSNGQDTALNEVIEKGGHAVSIMAMIFTFSMAILLAMVKKTHKVASTKLSAYTKWKKNITRQESIMKFFADARASIENRIGVEIEYTHQLGLDLMRVYGEKIDEQNKELYTSFKAERATPGFKVDADIYSKYQDIAMVDNTLIAYAIKNRKGIIELLERFDDVSIKVNYSLKELYKDLDTPKDESKNLDGLDSDETEEKQSIDNQIDTLMQ
ncbi:hypothetical protein P700755_002113 [Psychroflexus torquis ATCC 700755]|uniref:Uncharacterized protein n=1 Tax=Psychroflexus torquis (strain ATCC 700755 / CIP 106069 / ACAM 623) TaxID=313595 RepID=K4IEQ5_PSYTT|nr:hypothetical protein [Psychroflexus torquis]AFU68904.1 hypothetical protein P700755_002113 [Psychroflexus torquis ATCC 700755]